MNDPQAINSVICVWISFDFGSFNSKIVEPNSILDGMNEH